MRKLIFIFINLLSMELNAQYAFTKIWDKTLGGNKSEMGMYNTIPGYGDMKCYPINDGRILICGSSTSGVSGDKTQANWSYNFPDAWLVAVEGNTGQIAWDKDYGGLGHDRFMDLVSFGNNQHLLSLRSQNSIGGDFTVLNTYSNSNATLFRYLLLDSAWNVGWDRLWAGYGGYEAKKILVGDSTYCLFFDGIDFVTSDLIDTTCCTQNNADKSVIVCYDNSGNLKWDRAYGADDFANIVHSIDLIPDNSGYLVLENNTNSSTPGCDFTDISQGLFDVNIYSIDSIGQVIWQRCYGGVNNEIAARPLIKTSDGNFLFVASSASPQGGEISQPNPATGAGQASIWVVKINPSGGIIWDKRYGSCNGLTLVRPVIRTQDNGYLIGATTGLNDLTANCDISENGFGSYDYWLLKLDSAGNKEWDKRWGGSGKDYLNDIIQLSDGSYVAAGYSFSDSSGSKTEHNRDTTLASSDYWIVRFKAEKVVNVEETAFNGSMLHIQPNPADEYVDISINSTSVDAELSLIDITGRTILKQHFSGSQRLTVNHLKNGIYIIKVTDKRNHSIQGKVIKY